MGLADRYAEFLYRIAISRNRLKILITPVGIIFWFSFSVLFIFASLWLDGFLPIARLLPAPVNVLLSVPVLLLGAVLALWSVFSFGRARGSPVPINPPQRLVFTGLYSRIRNPMLLGWVIMLFGLGLLLNSISLFFIFAPLFFLLNFVYLKTLEEKEMERKFGQQYVDYKRSTPMFIPRFVRR